MKIPEGMEPLVFSYAYYKVKEYGSIISFFRELENKGLFITNSHNSDLQKLNGTFVMECPEGDWNPLSTMPGAKLVLGGARITDGVLKCDTKTKSGLARLRYLLETNLKDAIEFEKEEYEDIMDKLRKKWM